MSKYFEISEAEDVLGSLEHLILCLDCTKQTDRAWKWVVLSLFSAVQGALVCHAAGTTQIEVLAERNATKTLAWLNDRTSARAQQPEPHLASPDTLYKRLNGQISAFPPYGGVIETTPEQDKAFHQIKSLRDEFIHFSPKGWLIEKAFILCVIPPLIDLIQNIREKGFAFRHGDPIGIDNAMSEIRHRL